jgi:hypothetical protein
VIADDWPTVRAVQGPDMRTEPYFLGDFFLPCARALLRAAARAAAATRAAAQPTRITIGYTVNLIVTSAVRNLRRQHQDADVQIVRLDWNVGSRRRA